MTESNSEGPLMPADFAATRVIVVKRMLEQVPLT